MSFDTEKVKIGRQPFYVAKLYLDSCGITTFGAGACTGTGTPCYKTYGTCKSQPNFDLTSKVYTFCSNREKLPMMDMYPFIIDMGFDNDKRDPGNTIGKRGGANVLFRDTPHHDRGIDDNIADRSYDAITQGTFWTKLVARNEFYSGRKCEIYVGYLTDGMSDLSDFECYTYFIKSISILTDGTVSLEASDIFEIPATAVYPPQPPSELTTGINDTDTSITVNDITEYETYNTNYGYTALKIGTEIITYTGISTNTFTGCLRGQYGTVAASHEAGVSVGICANKEDENCVDTLETLFLESGVSSSYIPKTDWDTEFSSWLTAYTLNYCLSKPTKISTYINEIIRDCQLTMWWDAKDAEIKIDAFIPALPTSAPTITYNEMLKNSFSFDDLPDEKLSQVGIAYEQTNFVDDPEFKNMRSYYIAASDNSSSLKDGEIRPLEIVSRWFDSSNTTAVSSTSKRKLQQKQSIPKRIKFKMDIRHEQPDSDFFISVPNFVDSSGATKTIPVTIISKDQEVLGTTMSYECITTGAQAQRYGLIAPNTMGVYNDESSLNISKYCFISANSSPFFDDGTEAYKIL